MRKKNGDMSPQQAYQRLAALCARGEHCQFELMQKMRLWGLDEQQADAVLQRLVRERYVDDERYARAFVHDKARYNQWGRRKVELALKQKRVADDIMRTVLDEVPEVSDEEQAETLRPLLQQKRRTLRASSDYELRMKLMKWAMGRGFTIDVIRQCMDVGDEDEFLD